MSKSVAVSARVVVVDHRTYTSLSVLLLESESFVLGVEQLRRRYDEAFTRIFSQIEIDLQSMKLGPIEKTQHEFDAGHSISLKMQLSRLTRRALPRKLSGPQEVAYLEVEGYRLSLTAPDVQSLCTVAGMALLDGGLPPATLSRVERIYSSLYRITRESDNSIAAVSIPEHDRQIYDFLLLQCRSRETLPIRELYVCRDCGHEKISSPDYQKMLKRKSDLGIWAAGAAGVASLAFGGFGIFAAASRLLSQHQRAFVCNHCQGGRSNVSLVTLCPQCKSLIADPVLWWCSSCGLDLTSFVTVTPNGRTFDWAAVSSGASSGNETSHGSTPTRSALSRLVSSDNLHSVSQRSINRATRSFDDAKSTANRYTLSLVASASKARAALPLSGGSKKLAEPDSEPSEPGGVVPARVNMNCEDVHDKR